MIHKKKIRRIKTRPKLKCLYKFIIFGLLVFPANYAGRSHILSNAKSFDKNARQNYEHTDMMWKHGNDANLLHSQAQLQDAEETPHNSISNQITPTSLCCMCFIFAAAPMFTFAIIKYLQSQTYHKQCLVSKLYQEVLKTNLMTVSVWIVTAVAFKVAGNNNPSATEVIAKSIGVVGEALFMILMLNLMVIGILRLCIVRYKTLDLEFHWFGNDDDTALKRLRLTIWSTVAVTIMIMYLCSVKPYTYYVFKAMENGANDMPKESLVTFVADVAMVVACGILHIGGKLYLIYDERKLSQGYTMNLDTSSFASLTTQIAPTLMYLASALLVMLALLSPYLIPFKLVVGYYWSIITLFCAVHGIFLPALTIFSYNSVWEYVMRNFVRPTTSWRQMTRWINLVRFLVPTRRRAAVDVR